jgi:hypothetical protein
MNTLAEWAQDAFLDDKTGDFKFDMKKVHEQGQALGLAEEEIKIVIEDLERLNASRPVTAGAPGDGPNDAVDRLNMLLDNVDPRAQDEWTFAVEHAASIRDAIHKVFETNPSEPDQDKYARMLGTITQGARRAQDMKRPEPVFSAIDQIKEIRKESSVDTIAAMVDRAQRQEVSPVENSMIREVFEQGLRQSSADGAQLSTWWGMLQKNPPVQASTGHEDPQATIRAAFLMGQCTCELWRKAVAEVKKACGDEIKRQVHGLTRWGTIQPSEAAVRDIVLKTLQAKAIYPYPDFVQELMHALGYNPWQDRGLGPETDRSPQRESSVQPKGWLNT